MINKPIDTFTDKKILVTGGAGFIGSHLVQKLLTVTGSITSLDNYLSGSKDNHFEQVNYVDGDVNDIIEIFGSEKFDYIFHFGEYSRVEQSLEESHISLSNSYKSFVSLLEFWKSSGSKLVYSGSSTKFSDNGAGKHLSPYTAAKSLNTELLCDFADWYDLPFSIVYFYNVYGGRELRSGRYATVIGKYKELVTNGSHNLPVTKPGTQVRNFTHVDDIINGVLIAAADGAGDGYEIGAHEAYSILDLCELFQCTPIFQPASRANRMIGSLNTTQIRKLGWKQVHFLDEDISKFLAKIADQ